jgi:hypothetical protein
MAQLFWGVAPWMNMVACFIQPVYHSLFYLKQLNPYIQTLNSRFSSNDKSGVSTTWTAKLENMDTPTRIPQESSCLKGLQYQCMAYKNSTSRLSWIGL